MATGDDVFRTTADSKNVNPRSGIDLNNSSNFAGDVGGRIANQIPSVRSVGNIVVTPTSAIDLARGRGDQQDIENLFQAMPLGSWVPMLYLSSLIKDESKVPKKVKDPKREFNPLTSLIGENKGE